MATFIAIAALIIAFAALWLASNAADRAAELLRQSTLKETAKLRERVQDQGNDLIATESKIETLEAKLANLKVELDQSRVKDSRLSGKNKEKSVPEPSTAEDLASFTPSDAADVGSENNT